jgi:RNA polymerase sigma-70 factor (ECF subfamily)
MKSIASGFSPEGSGAFATTHWSVVQSAGSTDSDRARSALEQLCTTYWYPVYAFIRRRGLNPHEAEDLTQTFFGHLLERDSFKQADRQKGRFRNFLLRSLTNFLNDEWDKKRTFKRGGKQVIVSLEEAAAEDRYRCEPIDSSTPEKLFERRWALTLLQQVLDQLMKEYVAAGKAELFARLQPFITGEMMPGVYKELGAALGMKEETIRVALSRLRRRFGELLRAEIAHTVVSPEEVDLEIRDLFAAISRE